MRSLLRTLPAVLLVTCVAVTSVVAAESKAVQTMAGILAKLNHFASDAEKKSLKDIVDDKTATAPEKTVAQALINVQHTVSAADKPKLEALVADKATPESIKTLADVILHLTHTANDADKAKLKKLISPS
jgi:hypothetical protein